MRYSYFGRSIPGASIWIVTTPYIGRKDHCLFAVYLPCSMQYRPQHLQSQQYERKVVTASTKPEMRS